MTSRFLSLFCFLLPLPLIACSSDEPAGSECSHGTVMCSDDAYEVRTCEAGKWVVKHCMRDERKLCENGHCVLPSAYGSPVFRKCEGEPQGTPETLREKADGYEEIARRLHVHPDLKWMSGVELPCKVVDCEPGQEPPCTDCSQPAIPPDEATFADVQRFASGDNDGLWSALYLTSQAYRYAATKDADALAMIDLLLDGQKTRMGVTGVEGLYTRRFVPPNVQGVACPEDLSRYVPAPKKDLNQWVRVGDDGCVQSVDPDTMQFVSSSRCGLDAYKGYCWVDNVSIDEYSGHMLSHAAVTALVNDPAVREKNAALLRPIGRHLADHDFVFHDWDGRPTQYGRVWPSNLLSGFMAAMSWGFMKSVAMGSGDAEFSDYLRDCLLLRSSTGEPCIDKLGVATVGCDKLIGEAGVYVGCASNWNNFAMHMVSLQTLLLLEGDPQLRESIQHALEEDMWNNAHTDVSVRVQHNAHWDFLYAAYKKLGPKSDGPALDAVEDAFCMMRQFPSSQVQRAVECPPDKCVAVCEDRKGQPMSAYVRPVAERCAATFLWWRSPYSVDGCEENARLIFPPSAYLLVYWMGRYHGFIDEDD